MNNKIIYFAGFFDGEGSCIVRFRRDERYRTGYQVVTRVNVTQKHRGVLEELTETFGVGHIYFHKRDNLWHWDVFKVDDSVSFLEKILPFIIVKKKTCRKFLKVLRAIRENKHLSTKGLNELKALWDPETGANTR